MGTTKGLTIRQERFCQAYVETGCAAEAFRRSYSAENYRPNSLYVKAHMMLRKDKIGLRIAALKARQLHKFDITVATLTDELNESLRLALENGKCSAAVKAIIFKARLHGFSGQQIKVAVKHESTPEERLLALQSLLSRAAFPDKNYAPQPYKRSSIKLLRLPAGGAGAT